MFSCLILWFEGFLYRSGIQNSEEEAYECTVIR